MGNLSQEEWDKREAELNERHEIKVALTKINSKVDDLSNAILSHTAAEKTDFLNIIEAIEKSVEDRRTCEIDLRATMQADRDFNHKTFVKRKDLWWAGIIFLAGVSFITWFGIESGKHDHTASANQMLEQIKKAIKEK